MGGWGGKGLGWGAHEEEYFRKQNQEAMERIQKRTEEDKPRLSPITGEPMEQLTYMGVVIDRCTGSGGIWLDSGELEQILNAAKNEEEESESTWLAGFLGYINKK